MTKKPTDITIGVIGLGSIGLRHVNELIGIGINKIYALRTNKGSKKIPDELSQYVINVFDLKEFLSKKIDGYIISNPTSLHIEAINLVSKKNKPLFIEKPLCENLSDVKKINNINTSLIQIGFCLRFHNLFQKVKTIIDSGQLGTIYHSRINVGQYLPSWHPYTDYRTEYFSKKELGGGAIRTLSHEIDLAFYFFGNPISSKTITGKISNLEISVDDYALILLTYNDNITRIEIDFISKKKERKGIIYGTKADLHYDFFNNTIEITNTKGEQIFNETIKENNIYKDQMQSFINLALTQGESQGSSWEENLEILKIIENEKHI